MKSSNLRHSLAYSENKELSEYQRRASRLQTGPSPHQRQRGRWATARAGRQGAISAPEMASSTRLWAGSQLLTTSSWDPGWLTSARRVKARDQLPRGDTRRIWDGALVAHGNWGPGSGEVIQMHRLLWSSWQTRTWGQELMKKRRRKEGHGGPKSLVEQGCFIHGSVCLYDVIQGRFRQKYKVE